MNAVAIRHGDEDVLLPNDTRHSDHRHASRGGCLYPKEMREMVISIWQAGGEDALDTPEYNTLRAQKKFPCMVTSKRCIYLYQQAGNVLPNRPTGNHQSAREIHDIDLQYSKGEPYPARVNDQDPTEMIDIDEAGFTLQSQDRKQGNVMKQRRTCARGKYKRGGGRVNLSMGISGDERDPSEFHRLYTEGGTDLWRFPCFVEDFVEWLDLN
ncbi:hypothetical protein ACHAWF_017474 [Thalassiosira exigua]